VLALGVPIGNSGIDYFCFAMFLIKKANISGTLSVQIIDKSSGIYVVRETVGSSSDEAELSLLMKKGAHRISVLTAQSSFVFDKAAEVEFIGTFIKPSGYLNQICRYDRFITGLNAGQKHTTALPLRRARFTKN